MDVPKSAEVRTWSKVDFDGLEYEKSGTDDPLDLLVTRSQEYVESVTGRQYADMPAELEETAKEAIQRRVEQLAFKAQEEEVATGADFELIQSFSAGSYSETRRGLEDMVKSKMVNPWPLLHDLLWRMTTEDKKDEWYEWWGQTRPAFAVTEVDWHGVLLEPPLTDWTTI